MRKFTHGIVALIALFVFSAPAAWAQFDYIWPKDGSINNFREPHLILRNGALMDESSVTADKIILTGSKSGVVTANVVLSADGETVCITPAKAFEFGETVNVVVKEGLKTLAGLTLNGTTYNFSIRKEMTPEAKQLLKEYLETHDDGGYLLSEPRKSIDVPSGNSGTRSTFNFINISVNNAAALAPGEFFFHRNSGSSPTTSSFVGYGIMTNNADSIFYRASEIDGANFHVNLNGYMTALRIDEGVDTGILVIDSGYNIINVVGGQNGLHPSQHEHLFFPDGKKYFTCYDWQGGWDLSPYGGSDNATVNVSWIQGLDINNNVIFEWRSDADFVVTDATPDISLGTSTVDPWHINALYKDGDGHFIASMRNMDRIVKINGTNGNIIWQWGGLNSTYNEINTINDPDGGFSHQHNVHRIDNGHILMLDNGNSQPQATRRSQPKEYVLDETNLTATCVWYYTHPQVSGFNLYTRNQGSVQRMPNGNTVIGYGLPDLQGFPNGTEIDANKTIVWEFTFDDITEYTYRLYKTEWDPNVGIGDIDESNNNLQIFPNPANGLITVNVDLPIAEKATISVVNLLGQKVFSTTKKFHSGINTLQLDLTELQKGMYVVDIVAGKTKLEKRLIIQ